MTGRAAQRSGEYLPTGFATEGFIHCCFEEQLQTVLDTYFAGASGYLVLEVQQWQTRGDVRLEQGHDGQDYPHFYGPIRVEHLRERATGSA